VIAVGVPLISPFEVSNVKPAGSVGVTDQEVTVPPLEVGAAVVIAVPFVRVNGLLLYATDGATSLTVMVTVAVVLPPVLFAVMVNVVVDVIAVGVPLISPVDVSNDKPAGSVAEIDHVSTAPPSAVGVTAVMAESLVSVYGLPL